MLTPWRNSTLKTLMCVTKSVSSSKSYVISGYSTSSEADRIA